MRTKAEITIKEKLVQMRRARLARECVKLDPQREQALAEEGMEWELETWPAY